MIIRSLALGEYKANCYILTDSSSAESVVIDPGDYSEVLLDAIAEQGTAALRYILLTHGHFDHLLGASLLKDRYPDAQIAIGEEDAVCLSDSEANLVIKECADTFIPCAADRLLHEGDTLRFGSCRLDVLASPGHSKGGLCFVCPEERFVITGDTLFCRTAGRTDLPGGDLRQLRASVDRIMRLPDDYTIYPGHNRSTSIGDERLHNRFLRIR